MGRVLLSLLDSRVAVEARQRGAALTLGLSYKSAVKRSCDKAISLNSRHVSPCWCCAAVRSEVRPSQGCGCVPLR